MLCLLSAYVDFFLDYIFFYTPTCSDENVLREFGNSKTWSESIHGPFNLPWQENIRNEKE